MNETSTSGRSKITSRIFAVIVLVILAILIVLFIKKFSSSTEAPLNEPATTKIGEYYYPFGGFTMNVPDGWSKKDNFGSDDFVIGSIIKKEDVEFAFEKKNESCVLVYGLITGKYGKQTSFGRRIFTNDGDQIDSSWYVKDEYRPADLGFRWEGEQPTPHETKIWFYPFGQSTVGDNPFGFILYSANGGVVSRENCDNDISNMLSSMRVNPRTADKISDGLFYITTDISNSGLKRIIMVPEGTKESFTVDSFGIFHLAPVLKDNSLFYVSDTESLSVMNLKTLEKKTLVKAEPEKFVINGFNVLDNVVYYLAGKPCTEYRAKCDNGLYEFNLDSGVNNKLYEGSGSRQVLGKDFSGEKLYLAWIDGDAGCSWGSIEAFDLQTKQMTPTDIFKSECYDEETGKTVGTSYVDFIKTLVPKSEVKNYWRIKNGQITTGYDDLNTVHHRDSFLSI